MILRNRQGQESPRTIRTRTLEVWGDGDKGLIIFDTPNDIKGTAFLSFTHVTRPDDQWLYRKVTSYDKVEYRLQHIDYYDRRYSSDER